MLITYAVRVHNLKENTTEDFIAIRTEENYMLIDVPLEKIKRALEEFEKGEELNINY